MFSSFEQMRTALQTLKVLQLGPEILLAIFSFGPIEGLHQPEDADEQDKARMVAMVKKRKLYRQLTGQEVPWFPHDNDIELLKEFCWEAGRPRWVLFGTPAGGAGIHGCLELGCSVVALCYDEHHRDHLQPFLLQRAVEAMVSGKTQVFKDQELQARSVELNLTKEEEKDKKTKKEDKADEKQPKKPKKDEEDDEKTQTEEKTGKKPG